MTLPDKLNNMTVFDKFSETMSFIAEIIYHIVNIIIEFSFLLPAVFIIILIFRMWATTLSDWDNQKVKKEELKKHESINTKLDKLSFIFYLFFFLTPFYITRYFFDLDIFILSLLPFIVVMLIYIYFNKKIKIIK